jgi:integrase
LPKLTAEYVRKVKWKGPQDRDTHADALLPGFYLIVTKDGHKSYSCLYRIRGRQRKLTIGNALQLGLDDAREIARDAFAAAARGIDRQAEKMAARQAGPQTAIGRLFETQAREFVKRHVAGQRTARETEAMVERLIDAWGKRQVDDISKPDVLAHLDALQDAGYERARDRRRQLIRQLFDWLIEREVVKVNPAAGIRKLQPGGVKRQRVLTDDELRAIWKAAEKIGGAAEALVKLLMLTGQRRGEVATIEWPELDSDLWTVPPEKFKNGLVHLVPLPQAAVDVLVALPRVASGRFAISTTMGETGFSAFADLKEELDRISGVKDWVLHDIRRTVRTNLSKIGVNADVAERIIGHLPQGIRAVYDRHDFLEEKRAGLSRWAAHLDTIINPPKADAKVARLTRK